MQEKAAESSSFRVKYVPKNWYSGVVRSPVGINLALGRGPVRIRSWVPAFNENARSTPSVFPVFGTLLFKQSLAVRKRGKDSEVGTSNAYKLIPVCACALITVEACYTIVIPRS